jgi:hypothetical protein
MTETGLPIWVIYDHPRDYPDHFVVRRQVAGAGFIAIDQNCHLTKSLEEARNLIQQLHPGSVCLTRSPEDDRVIVESWL